MEWEKPKRLQQRLTADLKDTESWRSRLPKEKRMPIGSVTPNG